MRLRRVVVGSLVTALLAGCKGGGGADGIPALYINEFMASNTTSYDDGSGTYPDWIELYNGGDDAVTLEGLYITDDLTAPKQWALPALEVPPGGFLVLLADGNTMAGDDHLPFALSETGESIGLFMELDGEITQVDAVSYDAQVADTSSARRPDGGDEWVQADPATPGESNGG